MTVMDSLGRSIAHVNARIDSLGAQVPHAVHDTAWVAMGPANEGGVALKDVIGWLVTLGGIAVATFVTLRGWRKAADIARRGWESADATARSAQDFRRQIEESSAKAKLIFRIRGVLENTLAVARGTLAKDVSRSINTETMNSILVEWRRYDRVSDNLHLLGDFSFESELETTIGFSRMVAEKIIDDEAGFRATMDKLGTVTPEAIHVAPSVRDSIEKHRQSLHGLVMEMLSQSEAVLKDFNERWPAEPGHKERQVTE